MTAPRLALGAASAVAIVLLACGCGVDDVSRADDPPSTSTSSNPRPVAVRTPHPPHPTHPASPVLDGDPPGLLPEIPETHRTAINVGESFTTGVGQRVSLVGHTGGPDHAVVHDGDVQVVYRADGHQLSADVPVGWAPSLSTTPVPLGQAGEGFLVSQEGGDSDTRTLYVVRDDRLVPATVTGRTPFGGGFLPSGPVYRTWQARLDGAVYTSIGLPTQGHYRVYAWEVTGPGEGGGPDREVVDLVSRSLGEVCIDDATGTYGRC